MHGVLLLLVGSPPHTRGKESSRSAQYRRQGITPAHAGKRTDFFLSLSCPEDHPRTRGEKLLLEGSYLAFRGSPPHTRGKGNECIKTTHQLGITPAHAGKSRDRCFNGIPRWDHPRTRGEKLCGYNHYSLCSGSPPHTRGKGHYVYCRAVPIRITPAHAGKSFPLHPFQTHTQDHPRTRGEKRMPAKYAGR